jgi:hypothetical protein
MYVPPAMLGPGAGTVAFATALIVGGFAALGVAIGLPAAARVGAEREGARRAAAARGPRD